MAVYLYTGLPRNGKSLCAVEDVHKASDGGRRPVFFAGIKIVDFERLPWEEIRAQDWPDVPNEAIVLLDECHEFFPRLPVGAPLPRHYAEFATHAKRGIDIWLVTQGPRNLDVFVRERVQHHLHFVRRFGLPEAKVYKWDRCKQDCMSSTSGADTTERLYPKGYYGTFESAQVHNVKVKPPFALWKAVGFAAVALALVGYGFHRLHKGKPQSPSVAQGSPSGLSTPATAVAQTVDGYRPRFSALPWTAPRYDEVTKAVRAPYPAACIANAHRCQCYTQAGTVLETSDAVCRSVVAHGFFKDWDDSDDARSAQSPGPLPVDQQPHQVGQVGEPVASGARLRPDVEASTVSDQQPRKSSMHVHGGHIGGMGAFVADPPPPGSTSPADLALAAFAHGR